MDGTLVETNIDFPAMKQAVLDQANEAGIGSPELAGLDILTIIDESARRLTRGSDAYRREGWSILEKIELRHAKGARAIPFAPETLLEMSRRGWKLGLVTRNCRRASERLLTLLPDVFSVTLTRDDVARAKPDPLHLKEALRRLDARAEASVMVGDHRMDVQAGKASEMRTLGLLFERADGYFDSAAPDAVFADLSELYHALLNSDS